MTLDRMNEAPLKEPNNSAQISSREMAKRTDIYLKPEKHLSDAQKFNEKFRDKWNYEKELVHFIAYNKEIIGETIELWTHARGGVGAEFWKVPCGKPVWGPRYLAEQIKKCRYHRLVMEPTVNSTTGVGQFYGTMAVENTIQRLDAEPVSPKRSIFMGENEFKKSSSF